MNNWVPSYFFLQAIMDALTGNDPSSATDLPLEKVYLGLFISPTPAPTPQLLQAGVTEANYTSYARQAVVWFPGGFDVLGPWQIQASNLQFRPSDSVTPNVITGLFLNTNLTGGVLLLSTLLSTPVSLPDNVHTLTTSAVFQLAFTSNYGRALVWA